MKITIESRRYSAMLNINGKYSIITGNSGIGKTILCKNLTKAESEPHAMKVAADLPFHVVERNEIDLDKYYGTILIVDEFCKLLHLNNTASVLENSENYFIIVSRSELELDYLPVSIDNYYTLDFNGRSYTNKRLYPRFRKSDFQGIDLIVTEDAVSGLKFFEDYFPSIRSESAKSKSEIVAFLKSNQCNLSNTLIVYDAAAFAFQIKSLLAFIGNRFFNILDWESFENFILRSKPFETVLTQEDCTFHDESLEQKSTELLYSMVGYQKGNLCKCLKRQCDCGKCKKVSTCLYKHDKLEFQLNINGLTNDIIDMNVF